MAQYNDWQTFNYLVKYGSPKPKIKPTHWQVYYKNEPITQPLSYALCQNYLKQFKAMGYRTDLLKIKPYATQN